MNTAIADNSSRQRNRDRGAILMVVLIVMIALLGLGMTGLFLTGGSIQMNSNINLRNQALVVAEAGIERGRAILNNPALTPNMPALLAPTVSNPADDPIQNTDQCEGERRGAILRENGTPLVDIDYPALNRSGDLPGTGGAAFVSSTMGKYTVYIRQDMRDCRMGNFTCDTAPGGGVDGGVVVGVESCATPPPAGVPPNNVVVVRSEGVASDGRTRVVLEVTMSPSRGAGLGTGAPLSALCASGANGCDDNSSVQNGLVVTSPGPSSNGGASGSGAGGAVGGAGGDGNGGVFGTMPGTGAAGGVGGAGGGTGGGGTGGGGTGGTSGCKNFHGARVATMGVWGVWNSYVSPSTNDSGSAMFRAWLDQNFGGCQPIGSIINFGNGQLKKEDLDPYNVLIVLDIYHSNVDRWGCVSHFTTGCSNGGGHWCYGNAAGFPQACPGGDCTKCPTGSTSYMVGNQPALTAAEVAVITDWLQKGNGLVTTMGYYYDAPQVKNANAILRQIGLAYETTNGLDTGTVVKSLENPNGVDLCANVAGIPCPGGDDFSTSSPPFGFVTPVNRLEIRGAVPIVTVIPLMSPSPPPPKVSANVQCPRPIQTSNRCNAGPPAACNWSSIATPTNWQYVGYTAEDIGGALGGRVVAWGDEWLTYNTLWSTSTPDTYDIPQPATCASPPPYQAAAFWENVIAWLAVNNPDASRN